MTLFLWVIIMTMMAIFRIFQVYLGLPEMNGYFDLVQKGAWITMGIQYSIILLAYIFHRRRFAWMRK